MTAAGVYALENCGQGTIVPAAVVERVDAVYAQRAEDLWATFMAAEAVRAAAEGRAQHALGHEHWDWPRKVDLTRNLLSLPTLALECAGEPQALMLLQTDGMFCKLPDVAGRPLVYVMFLQAAPWNLRTVTDTPRYRGAGTALLRVAVETSLDLGFEGRVGLHALTTSETFYARSGMSVLSPDPAKQNLRYCEMAAAAAAAFLR
jgi:hypothetical protein